MKTDIHPEYVECRVTCSCGNQFVTRATTDTLRVELCSECHPFYTGKQKLVDTGGRVERFERRYAKARTEAEAEEQAAPKEAKRKKRAAEAPKRKPPVATKGGPRPKFDRKGRRIEDEKPGSRDEAADDADKPKAADQAEPADQADADKPKAADEAPESAESDAKGEGDGAAEANEGSADSNA